MEPISYSDHTTYTVNCEHTSRFGDALEVGGRFLTAPAAMFLSNGLRLIRKLEPGVHGQKDNVAKEVAMRVWYTFSTVGLLLANIALSPLELLGAGMRWAATKFYRKDCVFIKPEDNPQAARINKAAASAISSSPPSIYQQSKGRNIGICSFNVAAMATFIADNNGVEYMDTRAKKIAKQLEAMPDDIICIQEGFEGFGKVAEQLKRDVPGVHIIYDVARNTTTKLGSGLALISRHPIKHFEFWEHPNVGGQEVRASKGVLAATIELPNGQPVVVINTHLNGGARSTPAFPLGGRSFRSDQLKHNQDRALEYLEKVKKMYPDKKPALFTSGDYNIGPTTLFSKKERDKPKIDKEWLFDKGVVESGPSHFVSLMSQEDYGAITRKYLEVLDDSIEFTDEGIRELAKKIIQRREEIVKQKIEDLGIGRLIDHEEVNEIRKKAEDQALNELMKARLFKDGEAHYSSFDMEKPGVGHDGHPDKWSIKAEEVDHVAQGNEIAFPGILKTERIEDHISREEGVSDHTANHVTFQISN